jgi:nucleoside-diphosphate-sugar epimerase
VQKTPSIQRTLTASTAGPRFLASIFIWHTGAAAVCRRELRATITYSAPTEPGTEDAKKRPLRYAAKIALARNGGSIEILGDGQQSRTFLFITECIEGTIRLMRSDVVEPLNIGSDEMVTIEELADLIIKISGKVLHKT